MRPASAEIQPVTQHLSPDSDLHAPKLGLGADLHLGTGPGFVPPAQRPSCQSLTLFHCTQRAQVQDSAASVCTRVSAVSYSAFITSWIEK